MFKLDARRVLAVALGMIAWVALGPTGVQASAPSHSVTKPYSLGLGDVVGAEQAEPVGFDDIACNPQNLSDACFAVDGTEHTASGAVCDPSTADNCILPKVHIKAVDASGMPVPLRVHWYNCQPVTPPDPTNPCVNGGGGSNTNVAALICGEGDFAIPDPSAILIDVRPSVAGRAPIAVGVPSGPPPLACGQPEPVTQGTITVSGVAVKPEAAQHNAAPKLSGFSFLRF